MTLYKESFPDRVHLVSDAPLYRPNPTFKNPAWERAPLRVLIFRLSPFRDVQKSSTHLFLFREVRSAVPPAFIDMAFLPEAGDRALRAKTGAPLVLGTQSLHPMEDFDLVLASVSCVPELVNLPYMLKESGIPLWADMRSESFPPIILGGSSASAAHGLVREDGRCMADALFFGEGEGAVGRIAAMWAAAPAPRLRRATLASIADAVPGLWPAGDPSRRVRRAIAPEGGAGLGGVPLPVLPGEEAGTAQLLITRGCPCLCAFCFEGHERTPFRQIPREEIARAALELKEASGAETLEISSFNFNTHDRILDILQETHRLYARVNAMSQRVDILASTPDLLDAEMASGKRGFTIGVEGVSGALRRFLHKSLDESELKAVVERLHALHAREIKFFYILTGREEEADFKEFSAFISWMTDLRRIEDRGPRVIFSFGLLVRMPFTPLRHDGLVLDGGRWKRLIARAKTACALGDFEFRLATGIGEYLLIQALALGDRWTAELVEELAARGILYDVRFSPGADEVLRSWIERRGGEDGELSGEKPEDHPFPLPFLESSEERAFLHAQYVKAKMGIDDGYCRRGDPEGCGPEADRARCPYCTLGSRRGRREPGRISREASPRLVPGRPLKGAAARLADGAAAKTRLKPVLLGVDIPLEWAAPDGTWLAAVILKELCALGQRENVLSAREVTVTPWLGSSFKGSWFGRGIVAVTAWDAQEAARACEEGNGGGRGGIRFFTLARQEASFESLRLGIELPHRLFPRAEETAAAALQAMHAPFTAEKDGDWYRMTVSPKARGKNVLFGGRYRRGAEAFLLELEAGRKMDVSALFRGLPGGGSAVVINILDIT